LTEVDWLVEGGEGFVCPQDDLGLEGLVDFKRRRQVAAL